MQLLALVVLIVVGFAVYVSKHFGAPAQRTQASLEELRQREAVERALGYIAERYRPQ